MPSTHILMDFNATQLLAFYKQHLYTVLLPFWLRRSIDYEYGGYFTCFDNSGRNLLSHDKFTWSQGRMVWLWSRLAGIDGLAPQEKEHYLDIARRGALFLMRHCLLPNGHCTFLTDRVGTPKLQQDSFTLDSSIYADCFVIIGLARYALTTHDGDALAFCQRLYGAVCKRIESGIFNTEPYPTPPGYKAHGIPMIMLNTCQELARALQDLDVDSSAKIDQAADRHLHEIMDHFAAPDCTLHEMIGTDNSLLPTTLLGRYVNPGHTIESMWFVMQQARARRNQALIDRAAQIIRRAFAIGWDEEYGGLLHFADQDGGMPRGTTAGIEDHRMVQKIQNDWSNKLWWVHSEALYATLLAYALTGASDFLHLYRRVHSYTFDTFPNPDQHIGEWIQIRDRQGKPEQKSVALPVKDPYHIIRDVLLIIELLSSNQQAFQMETVPTSGERN